MTVSVNGIAHIQLTVNDPGRCVPFWEKLCHFLAMQTLLRNEDSVYCIGSRTGILVRGAPADKHGKRFDQDTAGLHHLCFRARSAEDVDAIARFVTEELQANCDVLLRYPVLDRTRSPELAQSSVDGIQGCKNDRLVNVSRIERTSGEVSLVTLFDEANRHNDRRLSVQLNFTDAR